MRIVQGHSSFPLPPPPALPGAYFKWSAMALSISWVEESTDHLFTASVKRQHKKFLEIWQLFQHWAFSKQACRLVTEIDVKVLTFF